MSDDTEIYGIEADEWVKMGYPARFEVLRDILEEEKLLSAELDATVARVAEERDEAREAARIIWTDAGEPYVTTEDCQTFDPLARWTWLKEHDDDQ